LGGLEDVAQVSFSTHGPFARVEFVRRVGRPPKWLLVSVKFLDDKREVWVNSALRRHVGRVNHQGRHRAVCGARNEMASDALV